MEGKRGNTKIIVIGASVIALAVALILLIIFVPRVSRKADMKDLLRGATAADLPKAVVGDLLPEGGNPLGNDGKETLLEGEDLAAVQDGLQMLLDEGFRYAGEDDTAVPLDLYVRVRTADGTVIQIYFTENCFYYKDGISYLFKCKNVASYSDFYNALLCYVPSK